MYHMKMSDDKFVQEVCKTAFPSYNGRKLKINHGCEKISMRSYWSDGSRNYFVVLRLQDNKFLNVPVGHPFFNNLTGVDDWMIQEGFVVVEHTIFCGKDLGLTIHTPSTTQFLLSGEKIELTRVQKMVLEWIVGLTSAGRQDSMMRYHFPKKLYSMICEELQEMGLVKINKAGSVSKTLDAKNLIGYGSQNNDGYSWWSPCYDYQTRKFTSEAAKVLQHYQNKLELQKNSNQK